MTDRLDLSRGGCGEGDEEALQRAREFGERLRAVFSGACDEVAIRGRLVGPAEAMTFEFEDQENAPGALILEHFVLELRERGLAGDANLRPDPAWSAVDLERAGAGLRANVLRLRGLLVEHNSYLSGGVPWVFSDTHPTIAARGFARYRFPARGPVHLDVESNGLRIRFEPGPLGETTSSGFYVPTRLTGDFHIELDYCIEAWHPGDDAACFALYVHDEAVLERYYVQRSASREDGDEHFLLANFTDAPTDRKPVHGPRGSFRILREGTGITCWHREAESSDWDLVGSHVEREAAPVITGAKVWSKLDSGGFDVRILDWRIEATVPQDQPPEAVERADPRG